MIRAAARIDRKNSIPAGGTSRAHYSSDTWPGWFVRSSRCFCRFPSCLRPPRSVLRLLPHQRTAELLAVIALRIAHPLKRCVAYPRPARESRVPPTLRRDPTDSIDQCWPVSIRGAWPYSSTRESATGTKHCLFTSETPFERSKCGDREPQRKTGDAPESRRSSS
jgi:hypothetical protein